MSSVKYSTFFVDDNIRFLQNLTEKRPARLFDDPYLAVFDRLHKKYGLKVQFNLFFEGNGFDLSMMTDAYKAEFSANSDWMKLGFHARKEIPDFPYLNAGYEKVKGDYAAVSNEIIRFAGRECLTDSAVTHWVSMSREGVQALVDSGIRIMTATGGESNDSPEILSALPSDHRKILYDRTPGVSVSGICLLNVNDVFGQPYLKNHNHLEKNLAKQYFGKIRFYRDADTGMYFNYFADITLNAVRYPDLPDRLGKLLKYEYISFLMHEQYFYRDYFAYEKDFEDKIAFAASFLAENGYKHIAMWDLPGMQTGE